MTLVDTDVMIDIRRGHPLALAWFDGLEEVPGLPGFVLMELVAGCKTRKDMREVKKQAGLFQIYWPTSTDCEQVLDIFMATRFSSGLSMPDAVIGAIAMGLAATLLRYHSQRCRTARVRRGDHRRGSHTPGRLPAGWRREALLDFVSIRPPFAYPFA
jgi:predicted nucleic acid-binding protein